MNLIIFSGLPGSGKSTLAESLAQKLQIPVFSVDPIESSIIKSGIPRSFETGLAAYVVVETLAREQLKAGISVIIDAVNGVREAREMWDQLAATYQAKKIVIECINSNQNLHKERIEKRVRNLSGMPEVTWEDIQKRKTEYLEWNEPHIVVDAAENIETNLNKVLKYI